jgi:hypothetical protein
MSYHIPKWKIDQLNILDLGNTIQVAGVIYADAEVAYLCMLPDEVLGKLQVRQLDLSHDDWKRLIRQTDIMETEILAKAADGKLTKAIVRKSTRQIEQGVSWAVYRRDDYKCRYCGKDDVPLTVDHLVLWEEDGPSIEDNLVSCCRKCNKARGNMQYADWLKSSYYKKVSQSLPSALRSANEALIFTLGDIPRRVHMRGR